MAYIFCVLITSMIWISAIVTKRSADRSYFALNTTEHANRAKTAFLNNMSHDIRTPINAIIGFTALAAAHVNQPDQVQEYLNKISTSGQHLLSLLNDVLDMSRIESGRVKIEEKEVHLPDVMHDLRAMRSFRSFRAAASSWRMTIRTRRSASAIWYRKSAWLPSGRSPEKRQFSAPKLLSSRTANSVRTSSPKCLADSPFLSAGTVNFLLLEKEEKKFTAPADFFLHSFGEVC